MRKKKKEKSSRKAQLRLFSAPSGEKKGKKGARTNTHGLSWTSLFTRALLARTDEFIASLVTLADLFVLSDACWRTDFHWLCPAGVRSEAGLLFGKLQSDSPSPYNSSLPSNHCLCLHVTLPHCPTSSSDTEQPITKPGAVRGGGLFHARDPGESACGYRGVWEIFSGGDDSVEMTNTCSGKMWFFALIAQN